MRLPCRLCRLSLVLLLAAVCTLPAAPSQKNKNVEPKSEVQPLPPEPPLALAAATRALDFHISPLLKAGGLSAQIRQSLNSLIRDTHGEKIVKLRAFVAGTGDARRVQADVTQLFTEHRLPLPVLSILQVGALGQTAAQVVIEAVVETPRIVNPNGLAFFYGQTGPSFRAATERLRESAHEAGVTEDHLLAATCFAAQISAAEDGATFRASFPHTQFNIVQAIRDPSSDEAMCEAVGQLSTSPSEDRQVLKSAHATLVNTDQLVFTGLQFSFGSYLNDAQAAFERMEKAAEACASSPTPVEVNGFSLDRAAASALERTNSVAPGVLTVQTIEGFSSLDATGGIEGVLATRSAKSGS